MDLDVIFIEKREYYSRKGVYEYFLVYKWENEGFERVFNGLML